jgi:hypothetical protein
MCMDMRSFEIVVEISEPLEPSLWTTNCGEAAEERPARAMRAMRGNNIAYAGYGGKAAGTLHIYICWLHTRCVPEK